MGEPMSAHLYTRMHALWRIVNTNLLGSLLELRSQKEGREGSTQRLLIAAGTTIIPVVLSVEAIESDLGPHVALNRPAIVALALTIAGRFGVPNTRKMEQALNYRVRLDPVANALFDLG